LMLLPVFVAPLALWFNWRDASLRSRCQCGKPEYELLGLLGRSYCYRCRSCGQPLLFRD
jgi:hypothetical protein